MFKVFNVENSSNAIPLLRFKNANFIVSTDFEMALTHYEISFAVIVALKNVKGFFLWMNE